MGADRCRAVVARALAALALLAAAGCTGLVFQPEAGHRVDPARFGIDYRDVRFAASDGVRLHAWFLPATTEARGTVVFAHGNAENVSTHFAAVAWLRERGFNVFAFDYRGYGRSSGTPGMVGVHRDTVAALDAADRADDLPRERLVLLGQSLGGAVATVVAARVPPARRPGVLVVDSAPSSYRRVTRELLADWWVTWPLQVPLSWTVTGDYAAAEAAPGLPAGMPKLFLGNRGDPTVRAQHARRLHARATPPAECWLIDYDGHVATFAHPALRDRFADWLARALETGDTPDAEGCGPPPGRVDHDPRGALR